MTLIYAAELTAYALTTASVATHYYASAGFVTGAREPDQFKVVPKRWIVERTIAWLGHFRRLAKDFEILVTTAENMVRIAMIKQTVAKCL